MPETDENKKLQKITRLLEKGGTMLASHHECGAPLFRYQGKVLCPVCDFEEKKEVPEARKPEMAEKVAEREEIRREVIPVREPQPVELSQVAALTQSKIHSIATSLEDETDLQRVKEKLECIELGLRVLKLLGP
ncbi:MAG: hypothetical protein OIN66_11985 [Candidatus Methanoperedens sp.]|nr:hypothetical protein [Candidatus Methanoperedens sp.]